MTTIAYSRGILAADRLVTLEGKRAGLTRKVTRSALGHIGAAGGHTDAAARFLTWIEAGCEGNAPNSENGVGLVVYPNGRVFEWSGTAVLVAMRQTHHAVGSGWLIATTAMALGLGPVAAVRIAIKLDGSTGGGVDTLRLRPVRKRA